MEDDVGDARRRKGPAREAIVCKVELEVGGGEGAWAASRGQVDLVDQRAGDGVALVGDADRAVELRAVAIAIYRLLRWRKYHDIGQEACDVSFKSDAPPSRTHGHHWIRPGRGVAFTLPSQVVQNT